ncbi:DNA-binding transcriptional regulator SfsB [Dryocola clanedunensis]|uniref:DNA-binding transcriptional regulator SfsB n=1 Tax=Cedecea sulfonylureivorans TaxID=3051154 RepID=UPI0019279E54|nr:DNA-binding transcriptional regulator SfsB [Cedecea sulfonylureivorans]
MNKNQKDWHPADIIAGLRKRGTSLAAESRKAGLNSATLANALSRPWPKGEQLIARALNTNPWSIWPSRYYDPQTNEFIDRSLLIRAKSAKGEEQD